MDVQTGFVYIGVVILSAVVIMLVSMFGIKEKSYEEAIAEQRKHSDDLLSSKKDKNKEKKHKNKAGKKVKEKKEDKDDKEDKDEKTEHVQFEETPQILPPELPIQECNKGNKKKGKLEKIKPILVNKDEPLAIVTELSPSQPPMAEANHFDLIHPKDDLELVRSQSKENLQQMIQIETTANKSPKDTPTKSKKNNKDKDNMKKKDENPKDEKQDVNTQTNATSAVNKESVKEIKEMKEVKEVKEQQKETPVKEVKEALKETATIVQSSNKEPKKTKRKNDLLAQIEGDAVNVQLLMLFIQKAELSRSEIQILIDQLLNKQMDNPSEHSEWTEGRADPVIKLKKQLAEKEKALNDEHEASIAFQNKLKELRTEFNSEKSKLSMNIKQLEETLSAKIAEAMTLHTRIQHIIESHTAEKQGFARQIEQLQTKVNEDAAIIHKMQEEQGQTQGHMQQELLAQRKQMDVQITQMRESEKALKVQLTQKHAEMQDLQNELHATVENSSGEIDILRQQVTLIQGQLIHSENQLQHYKDADHRYKSAVRHEQELQKQVSSLQAELNLVKNSVNEASTLKLELDKAQSELMKLKSELSASMNTAELEAAEVVNLKTILNNKDDELKKSREEFDTVRNDMQNSNAQIMHMESKLNSTQNEIDTVRVECDKTKRDLKEAKNDANKYMNEAQTAREMLTTTRSDLVKARVEIEELNRSVNELKSALVRFNRLDNEEQGTKTHLQITKLQEENDRLRSELVNVREKQEELQQQREQDNISTNILTASKLERPAAEGRENVEGEIKRNTLLSSDHAISHPSAEDTIVLNELKTQLAHKEEELNRLNEQLHVLKSEATGHNSLTSRLQDELENQKSKNNKLRVRNWKVMEYLSTVESRAKSSDGKNSDEIAQKVKAEQEEATKALLQRIFPEIKISGKTHEHWLNAFENKVSAILNDLKENSTISKRFSELEEKNTKLRTSNTQYKGIIADAEGMLNKLQSKVESEESKWQHQLQQKENEIAKFKAELEETQTSLKANEKAQQEAIELGQKVIEMQQKMALLENRVTSAESLTDQANSEVQALRFTLKSVSREEMDGQQLATLEKLQEEKARLSQELQTERSKRASLDTEMAKLRSLVENKEASLAQEKNLVTQLHQEMSQLKNEIYGGCSSSDQSILNGPPASDSLQPQDGSGKK